MSTLYDILRTPQGWRFIEDLNIQGQFSLDYTLMTPQSPAGTAISFGQNKVQVQQWPGSSAAFLVLRHLDLSSQRAFNDTFLKQMVSYQDFTFSVSANQTGWDQTETFNPPEGVNYFKAINLRSIPAGVTITDVKVRPLYRASNNPVDLFTGNLTAPTLLKLSDYSQQEEGIQNPFHSGSQAGYDVHTIVNNTNASAQNVSLTCYGAFDAADWAQVLVQYQDWTGKLHTIGVFDDRFGGRFWQLDQVITTPLQDPGQVDFGQLVLTVLQSEHNFLQTQLYNLTLTATIAYLAAS